MFKHDKDLIIKTQEYDVNTELLKLKFQLKFLKCPEGAGEELSSRISNSVTVCEVEVIKLMNYSSIHRTNTLPVQGTHTWMGLSMTEAV